MVSWGEPAAELDALFGGCGVVLRHDREPLDLTGEDRARFLHGLVTFDAKSAAPGEGRHGFFTDIQGKILADVAMLALPDRLRLWLPAGRAEPIEAHLGRYRIADRVDFERPGDLATLLFAGPGATAAVVGLTGARPPEAAWGHLAAGVGPGSACILRDGLWPVAAFAVTAAAETAAGWIEELSSGLHAPARLCGWRALDTLRVECGVPLYGREYAGDAFPQETGIEGAVSYEKGCYLGQEVVARIHYRGRVNRVLRGLELGSGPLPEPGAEVSFEGRSAGALGTVVRSARTGEGIALALLHRRAADPGTQVEVAGAAPARVVEPPRR